MVKELILGFRVDSCDVRDCVAEIMSTLTSRSHSRSAWLACFNPHSYAVSRVDGKFASALRSADWLVADGVGVVLASRVLGGDIKRRVTGSHVFFETMRELNRIKGSVFFLGASEETLRIIRHRVKVDFPAVRVAGTHSPPFRDEFDEAESVSMCQAVNSSKPDVLWVGMTAPKQEKWIAENLHRLRVPFVAGIGAVFDFYTGRVKRSHPAFQALGLEWLPRLAQQPRRLWRRTFISAPIFVAHVIKQRYLGSSVGS